MRYFLATDPVATGDTIGLVREDGQEWAATINVASRDDAIAALVEWVGDDVPEFWGYCAAADWLILDGLFERRPHAWPGYCCDLGQLALVKGNPRLEQRLSGGDVLEAARWVQQTWHLLTEMPATHPFKHGVHAPRGA